MKKLKTTGIIALLTLALAGCSSSSSAASSSASTSNSSSEDHLARIKEAGKITVGMEGDWQPFTYHEDENDPTSKMVGFDAEVSEGIAKQLGVEVEFVEADFDATLMGVSNGTVDMAANGIDITEEREKTFYFSDPYAYDHTVLVTRKDNTDIHSFDDLDGKTTANSNGSTYQELGEQYGATVKAVPTLAETLELVKNGTADATINAQTAIQDYFNTVGQGDLEIRAVADDSTPYGIIVKKDTDNDTLLSAINDALDAMRKDGSLAEISEKYFGADLTSDSSASN